MKKYSMGIDFGTLSARAVLASVEDGRLLDADAVFVYPHGVISELDGKALPKDYALQHPEDYIAALEYLIAEVIAANKIDPSAVVGIGIDFTACTVFTGGGFTVSFTWGFSSTRGSTTSGAWTSGF